MKDIIAMLLKSAEVYTARARRINSDAPGVAYLLVKHSLECIYLARELERVS